MVYIYDVYNQYKHLDALFCDKKFLGIDSGNHIARAAYDFWQAIKKSVEKGEK